MVVATGVGAIAILLVMSVFGAGPFSGSSTGVAWTDSAATDTRQATQADVGVDGVQQLKLTLRYPAYEPRLLEAKAGVPLRLSVEAIGEPGCGAVTLVRGLGQRLIARANQTATIEFTPDKPGEYVINCSMNMLRPATLRITS